MIIETFFWSYYQYIPNLAEFYAPYFFPQQQQNKNQKESLCNGKGIGFAPSQNLAVFGSCARMAKCESCIGKKGGFVSFAKTKEKEKNFFNIFFWGVENWNWTYIYTSTIHPLE